MAEAIRVHSLTKKYGELVAVNAVDFSVPTGQVFAFLGPNGAGKTTTVEILEGLRRPTSGEVQVMGLDPWTEGDQLHRTIGVIPQDFRFFEKIQPREAIGYYATLFAHPADPERLLGRVGLLDKATDRFENLSGGQKQKLGLALALVNDPTICFLDEPTTGLDPQARRGIWEVIRQLKAEGRTVFLTTHYLEEAELLADQVAIIHHGQIIARGTPSDIIAQHGRADRLSVEAGPAVAQYLTQHAGVAARSENGRIDVPLASKHDVLRVLTALETSGLPWSRFSMEKDTLEDVFVALVGRMDDGVLHSESTP